MQRTGIEYITHTWNPIKMTCTPVSSGCDRCWHLAMGKRFGKHTGKPVLIEKELVAPLRLRKPARIGVQFMGDLFHKDVPDEFLDEVFAVMAACPQHTFIVLTKRPKNMRDYLCMALGDENCNYEDLYAALERRGAPDAPALENVICCTSVEDQQTADERIRYLFDIPGARLAVSYEPALGPVNFEKWLGPGYLDWLIMGGESGAGARPMKKEWAESVVRQCQTARVPLFYKQGPDEFGNTVKMPRLMGRLWKEAP